MARIWRRSCRQPRRSFSPAMIGSRARSASSSPPRTARAPTNRVDLQPRRPADARLRARPHQTSAGRARGTASTTSIVRLLHAGLCRQQAAGPGWRAPRTPSAAWSPAAIRETSVVDPTARCTAWTGLYVSRRQRAAAHQPGQSGLDHLCLGAAPRRTPRQADGVRGLPGTYGAGGNAACGEGPIAGDVRSQPLSDQHRVWLRRLSRQQEKTVTLKDVPDDELDRIAALGFDWVWLLSVWQTGEASRRY